MKVIFQKGEVPSFVETQIKSFHKTESECGN